MNEANFMADLLAEVEQKENQSTEVYMSMLVKKAAYMQKQIEDIFKVSEEEVQIIKDFALAKCAKIQGQLDGISSVLEAYIREKNAEDSNIKTIDFTHGSIKLRRPQQKVIVEDLELFLKNANDDLLTHSVKPNLVKIKTFTKLSGRLPEGCVKIEPTKDEFSLKLKEVNNG